MVMTTLIRAIALVAVATTDASAEQRTCGAHALACSSNTDPATATLDEAQRLFYSGQYDEAAALALAVRRTDGTSLAALELRSSALHFQIRRALGSSNDRDRAWKACGACPELMSLFLTETNLGRAAARASVKQNPADIEALFFLGKLNLNYVWLQLGTLGRKSGWSEYWEARKSLDGVLKSDPDHVRARVARAWIDYIVDTKVPRGTKWLLGGGNRKRGLQVVREATEAEAPPFVQAEAMFALWDMLVRERNLPDAVVTARALARDFPDNRELSKFLFTHDLQGSR
jgi:tetratricopeptide (TPR) repeat protein